MQLKTPCGALWLSYDWRDGWALAADQGRTALFALGRPRLAGLGAVYGAATAGLVLINMNPPIPFHVYAPNYAEAVFVLLIGLTGALACLAVAGVRGQA